MWSLVVLSLVCCAAADPLLLISNWAEDQFATPSEAAPDTRVDAPVGPVSFVPALPPRASFIPIRDAQAAPPAVVALRRPAHTVSFVPPFVFLPPPFFLNALYLRVPDVDDDDADVPLVPVAVPIISFASQHNAQVPATRPFFEPLVTPQPVGAPVPGFASQHDAQAPAPRPAQEPLSVPIPVGAPFIPSFASQHTAQVPLYPRPAVTADTDDDDDDDAPGLVLAHFPTRLAEILSFRGVGDEPVAPAGIVQSTQPSFRPFTFKNDFAHPSLHDKAPSSDGSVLAV